MNIDTAENVIERSSGQAALSGGEWAEAGAVCSCLTDSILTESGADGAIGRKHRLVHLLGTGLKRSRQENGVRLGRMLMAHKCGRRRGSTACHVR